MTEETGMKKVIVTGGGGFVGKAIVRQLLSQDVMVTVVGRNNYPDVLKLGAEVAVGDIRNRDFLVSACENADTIFHVAARAGIWGSWEDYYSVNVTGTENVMAACRANRIGHLVYTSTPSVVFAGDDLCGVGEETPYAENFLCHYAHTKVLAEKMVLAGNSAELKTTALRPHLVWGPGDTNLIPRLVERGRKGQLKIVGDATNMVDISYIDNVASAHVLAADSLHGDGRAAGHAYFISQGDPVNLWEWINDLYFRLGIVPVKKKIGFKKAYLVGTVLEKIYSWLNIRDEPRMTRFLAEQLAKSHWFSIQNAKDDFGYTPLLSTETGMERLVKWVGDSGLLA